MKVYVDPQERARQKARETFGTSSNDDDYSDLDQFNEGLGTSQPGWDAKGDRTHDRSAGRSESAGTASHEPEPWQQPVPLGGEYDPPPFPIDCLPPVQAEWVRAEAEAMQTPPDLAAMLDTAICGAGLAKTSRVIIREGWTEPTNILTVQALPPGNRKSAVFADAIAPVLQCEREERQAMAREIAEAASEHRTLEARLKHLENKAAKEEDPDERRRIQQEEKGVADELAAHVVPAEPEFVCDDVTPERLGWLLARQGGRMLQASAEGTAFEIAKGRYAERANFDVYLKGHSGDPLKAGRMSRDNDEVDQPALSVALAVQPDVIRGLAEQATMRGRGFLARFLNGMPRSRVGTRTVRPVPVPAAVSGRRYGIVLALWRLPVFKDQDGRPAPQPLTFSPGADRTLEAFERWLEPQLLDGQQLSHLAGWANKLAGAVARIAGIWHMIQAVSADTPWGEPVSADTVGAAARLAKDYLIQHALAAFAVMGADPRVEQAKRVVRWLRDSDSVNSVKSVKGVRLSVISKRDIHAGVWGGTKTANEVEPVFDLLVNHHYLRPVEVQAKRGPGRNPSQRYIVNPHIWTDGPPFTKFTEFTKWQALTDQNSEGSSHDRQDTEALECRHPAALPALRPDAPDVGHLRGVCVPLPVGVRARPVGQRERLPLGQDHAVVRHSRRGRGGQGVHRQVRLWRRVPPAASHPLPRRGGLVRTIKQGVTS